MRRDLLWGVLMLGLIVPGDGRVWAQTPSAVEIVTRMMARNAERQAMLASYASERTYRLVYSGVGGDHHAEMVVHAEYTAPGRKHFTVVAETGSKVLCKEVLRKLVETEEETAARNQWQRAMFSPETHELQLLGREEVDGVSTWVLQVEPKVADKVSYRAKIWVSTEDYAAVRVLGEPAKTPLLLDHANFDTRYVRKQGFWLPESNVATSHVRLGGVATVTIDYGSYGVLARTFASQATASTGPVEPARSSGAKAVPASSLR